MSKKSMSMCYPYGMGVSCICDSRGRIYKCFPNPLDMSTGAGGEDLDLDSEALLSRGQLVDADGDGVIDERDLLAMSESEEARRRRGLDERTEIILAATFLVLVILAFISFVIYRCEKNYVRRRLHETFHISPSTAALHSNGGGLFSAASAATVPSISVSVQTDPVGLFNGHLAQQQQQQQQHQTILANGHIHGASVATSASFHHHNGNGHVASNSTSSSANHYHHLPSHLHGYSVATLPHNAHLAGGRGGGGDGTALPSSPAGTDNASEEPTSSSNGVGGHSNTSGYGGSNIVSSHSYRDVRGGVMTLANSTVAGADNANGLASMANNNNNCSSRDNTLSRNTGGHHASRDDGLSNLRGGAVSPTLVHHHSATSASHHRSSLSAGITMTPINILNGNDDEDDYAESDVMLGGGGNNGGGNNNGGSSSASGASGGNPRF